LNEPWLLPNKYLISLVRVTQNKTKIGYAHNIEISIFQNIQLPLIFFVQAGDDYLSGLAARYASELGTDEVDVLHQLDDFRQLLLENSSQIINNDSTSSSTKKHHLPNSGANNVTTTMMMMGESSRQNECHISPISGQRINNVDCRISPISGHTYANLHDPYTSNNQRTFSPGIYAVSYFFSPGVNFINVLRTRFSYKSLFKAKT